MKKLFLATTALSISVGCASAQGVEITGSAEMGIIGGDSVGDTFQFHTDIDVTFTFTGETDNGLTFGGSIDLDESDGSGGSVSSLAFGNTTQGGETVFLSGNFGTVTMGDTDGAFDWALQELGALGSIDDSHTAHLGYNGNSGLDGRYDGQIVRYDYSFGDFAFAVSVELDDAGVGDPVFGIGGRYSGTLGGLDLGVGLGYQTVNGITDTRITGFSADAEAENWWVGINYSFEAAGAAFEVRHLGIGARYDVSEEVSVSANYGQFDPNVGAERSGFGTAINYDLGGGAAIQFGYGRSESGAVSTDSFSLGVAMSF